MQVTKISLLLGLVFCIPSIIIQASEKDSEKDTTQSVHKIDDRFQALTQGFALLGISFTDFMIEKNAGHWPYEMITLLSGEQKSRMSIIVDEAEAVMIAIMQKHLQDETVKLEKDRISYLNYDEK